MFTQLYVGKRKFRVIKTGVKIKDRYKSPMTLSYKTKED